MFVRLNQQTNEVTAIFEFQKKESTFEDKKNSKCISKLCK